MLIFNVLFTLCGWWGSRYDSAMGYQRVTCRSRFPEVEHKSSGLVDVAYSLRSLNDLRTEFSVEVAVVKASRMKDG